MGVLGVRGIEGLDVAGGVANAGGARRYMDLRETYCREARGRMDALRTGGGEADRKDVKDFVTNGHAIKGSSANRGAAESSAAAALLEAAGLRGDAADVGESVGGLRDGLAALVERIEGALAVGAAVTAEVVAPPADAAGSGVGRAGAEAAGVLAALANLRDALEAEDIDLADRLMEEISAAVPGAPGTETRELLSRVAALTLTSDFQEAARAVAGFIGFIRGSGR
jgi:HPt (histidine-containing phosphotransfer) domain-containing protein